jgi:uncharacterized protein YecT (DUF1311 family)
MIGCLAGGSMPACPVGLIAFSVAALWVASAAAQPAPDCAKAPTPAEQAICRDLRLAAADAAMAEAYAALRATRSPVQRADLQRDQRQWIKDRDAGCSDRKDAALVQCLLRATEERRHLLAGEGDNGAAGAPTLLPVYFYEAQPKQYEIDIAYPQFAARVAPKFNAAVRAPIFGKDALSEYRTQTRVDAGANFYQVAYDTTYLAPNLVSVTLQLGGYSGGAHPNNWRVALLWNLAADKPIAIADFLADPVAAVLAISALCKAHGEKEDWGLFDKPDFAAVVRDPASWAVAKDGVTIQFDPYSVTPYVAGPHNCRLSYAGLKPWLKPGGPLPPR